MRTALAAAVLAAVVCAAGGRARADAYDATLTRAIAAKERAMDVNEPARWEEALRLFQEADAIRATREASYELGHAAERLARTDLAVEAYEAALNLGLTGQPRSKAETFVGAHAAALARVQIKGASDGRVRSGGIDRGRLPLRRPLVLFPGEIVVEIIDSQGHRTPHRLKLTADQPPAGGRSIGGGGGIGGRRRRGRCGSGGRAGEGRRGWGGEDDGGGRRWGW